MKKEHNIYIDYARAIAIFFMVIQHVCIFLHPTNYNVTLIDSLVVETILMITKSAVPMFVIITGSVLLDKEQEFSVLKAIKKSFNMLTVICFWNIVMSFYSYCMGYGIKESIRKLIFGNYWYLYMLVGLYLLIPAVNLLCKDKKISMFLIFFTFIYCFYLSFILLVPFNISQYISKLVNKLMFSIITGYTGFLLLGFIIRNYITNCDTESCLSSPRLKKYFRIFAIFSAAFCFILLVYSVLKAYNESQYNYELFDEFSALCIGGGLFHIVLRKKPNLGRIIIPFIGTHSLGIYVVSNIVLDIYEYWGLNIEMFSNIIIGIVVCVICILVPSISMVYAISRTPLKKFI